MAVAKVKRRGRVMWRARVKRNGVTRTAYRSRRDDALEAERELVEELEQPALERKEEPTKKTPTLSEMWPDFVAFQVSTANSRPWRPRTRTLSEQIFHGQVEPVLGTKAVDAIRAKDVDRLVSALESGRVTGRKLRPNTVANAMGLLQRMLRVAQRWGLVEAIPEIKARKRLSDKIEDNRWLTTDETERLLAAACPEWHPILVLAVRTGLRLGELRGLRWADVAQHDRVHVRRSYDHLHRTMGPTKGGNSRLVPLTEDARQTLQISGRDARMLWFSPTRRASRSLGMAWSASWGAPRSARGWPSTCTLT